MDVTHDGGAADDARLVERVQRGDSAAFAPLFERWYDRVYGVARSVVRRPDLAADVAQDAFVAAWQQIDRLDDVNAFGGWLLRITRNRALDALRHEQRSAATDDDTLSALTNRGLPSPVAARSFAGPAETAESHAQADLLWAAAAALGERDASILDLHVRHGLTPAELADDLGVEPNHAHQLLHRLRKRLGDAVGAFLLWNGGRPNCELLAARVIDSFDAACADTITRHARTCATCSGDRSSRTDPVKLFAAVPVAIAPLVYRSKAAWALESAGAPMPSDLLRGADGVHEAGDADDADDASLSRRLVRVGAVATLVVLMLATSAMLFADQARAPMREPDDMVAATTLVLPTTTVAVAATTATTTPTTLAATTTSAASTTTTPLEPPRPPAVAEPVVSLPPAATTTTTTSATTGDRPAGRHDHHRHHAAAADDHPIHTATSDARLQHQGAVAHCHLVRGGGHRGRVAMGGRQCGRGPDRHAGDLHRGGQRGNPRDDQCHRRICHGHRCSLTSSADQRSATPAHVVCSLMARPATP